MPDEPEFNDAPHPDQPATRVEPELHNLPDPGDELEVPGPGSAGPATESPPAAAIPARAKQADPAAGELPPPPPPPPPVSQGARFLSNALLMVLGAILAAGGYGLARTNVPPSAPTEIVSNTPNPGTVKVADLKAIAEKDDTLEASIDGLSKRIDMLPKPDAELKTLSAQSEDQGQKVVALSGRLDGVDQKLAAISTEATAQLKARLDDASKQIDDLARQVAVLAPQAGTRRPAAAAASPAPAAATEDINVEGRAMEKAAGLYSDKKYPEARDAFAKLQGVFPDDARVWYYSALATGFATGKWTGEPEKLVATGMEKEKAGSVPADRIDAVFAGLTPATGKDWLDAYRKRIAR